MLQVSTIPVGYTPTSTSSIRNYCAGNNGYFTKITLSGLDYGWETDDGVLFPKSDGNGSGIGIHGSNFYSSTKSSGMRLSRVGKRTGRQTFFLGDLAHLNSNGSYHGDGMGTFMPNVVGVAFKFSKADTGSYGNNTRTECRIQHVGGVYVDGSSSSTNGKIYSYNYGTVGTGSLGFNAEGISTSDKFCCYLAGNSTGRNNIRNKPLLLIGFLFDLNFNHNGTGEQNPSGQFWQARPIISLDSSNGSTSKPSLLLAYPFENTKWSQQNPYYSNRTLPKLNTTRV